MVWKWFIELPAGSFSWVAVKTGLEVPVTGTSVLAVDPNPIVLPAPNPVFAAGAVPNNPPVVPAVVVVAPKGFPKPPAVLAGVVVVPNPPVVAAAVPNPVPNPVVVAAGVDPKRPVPVPAVVVPKGLAPNPVFAVEPNPNQNQYQYIGIPLSFARNSKNI